MVGVSAFDEGTALSKWKDDARVRPDLFHWNGPIDPSRLQAWVDGNSWLGPCPGDLLAFWQETRGGDVLESETILGPFGDESVAGSPR